MAEGSIVVLYVFLALAPHVAGYDNDIKMKIKAATGTDVLTVRFPESTFIKFYNWMCAGAYTQQTGNLRATRTSLSVTEVFVEKLRTREHPSKYFTCRLHNGTSETINCTMLFDHDGEVSSEGSTESFHLRGDKGDCDCVGIRWTHPGETLFSNDSETILRPTLKYCEKITPALKIFTTQASTIVTTSHINTSDLAAENTAQDNNLLLIITVVVGSIILILIFVALFLFIRQRRHTIQNYLPNACIHDQATNMLVPDLEPYFTLENAVSNNTNRTVEENQYMVQNMNDVEPAKFRQNWKHRIPEDKDQGYVAMSDIDKTIENEDEHYDAIVDDENDNQENVKVTDVPPVDRLGVAPVWDVKNDKPQSRSGEDTVYEGYNETICRETFLDATVGSERKHKVQDEIVYTSVIGNYALQDTTDVFKKHTSDINPPCTVNSYDDVSFDNTNQNYYGNIYMVNSDKSEHLKEDNNVRDDRIDANTEGHDHQGSLANTPDVGDDVDSAAFYSRLRTEVCKRANPYDALCESDKQQI